MPLVPMVIEQTGRGERYLFKIIKRENYIFT